MFRLELSVAKMAPPAATAVLPARMSCVELTNEHRLLRGRPKALKTYWLSGLPSAKSNGLVELVCMVRTVLTLLFLKNQDVRGADTHRQLCMLNYLEHAP